MNIIQKLTIFYSTIFIIETIVLIIIWHKIKNLKSKHLMEIKQYKSYNDELKRNNENLKKDTTFKIKEERALSLLSEKNLKEAFKSEIDTLKDVIKQLEKDSVNAHKIISDLNKQLTKKL